jgi:hypothetical protein
MGTLSLRLPDSLHARLRDLAQREGVSINQLIMVAVAEKAAALLTEEVIEVRARRASREKFDHALSRVADVPPPPYDALPSAQSARPRRRRSRSKA